MRQINFQMNGRKMLISKKMLKAEHIHGSKNVSERPEKESFVLPQRSVPWESCASSPAKFSPSVPEEGRKMDSVPVTAEE